MSRFVSAPFFGAHPVFRRAEYAAAVGHAPGDRVVTAMLAQHLKASNIRRIAREVCVRAQARGRTHLVR